MWRVDHRWLKFIFSSLVKAWIRYTLKWSNSFHCHLMNLSNSMHEPGTSMNKSQSHAWYLNNKVRFFFSRVCLLNLLRHVTFSLPWNLKDFEKKHQITQTFLMVHSSSPRAVKCCCWKITWISLCTIEIFLAVIIHICSQFPQRAEPRKTKTAALRN